MLEFLATALSSLWSLLFDDGGIMLAALPVVQQYRRQLIRILRPQNSFASRSISLGNFVQLGTEVLNIPIETDDVNVVKNPSSFPLSSSKREHNNLVIKVDQYATLPHLLPNAQQIFQNVELARETVRAHNEQLVETIHNDLLLEWVGARDVGTLNNSTQQDLPADNTFATTGSGSPKAITKKDLAKAAAVLDAANIPSEGRFVIVPPSFAEDMRNIQEFTDASFFGRPNESLIGAASLPPSVFGFIPMVRTKLPKFDTNTGKPVPYDSTSGTAVESAIFWQQNSVAWEPSQVFEYSELQKPALLGSEFNFEIFTAAGRLRNTGVGMIHRG